MSGESRPPILQWLTANRNLFLFSATVTTVMMLPTFEDTPGGDLFLAATNVMIVVVAVAVNGRSRALFWLGLSLSFPAVVLRIMASRGGYPGVLTWSWVFMTSVLVVSMFRLLQEVFAPGPVTRDKLFGCATVYLLIGLLWCFLFAIVEELTPGAFSGLAESKTLRVADLAYFSLNVVTGVALTHVLPESRAAQVMVLLLEYASILYMTFVISRLVGMYAASAPPSIPPSAPPSAKDPR